MMTPAIDRMRRALPRIDRAIAAARKALSEWEYAVVIRPFRERVKCQARLCLPWDYDHDAPIVRARW